MKVKNFLLNLVLLTSLSVQLSERTLVESNYYGDIYSTRSQRQTYKEFFHLNDETFDLLCKYIDLLKQQNKTIANNGSANKPEIFQNLMEYIKSINPVFHRHILQNMKNRLLNPEQEATLYLKYREQTLGQRISQDELQLETDLKRFRESW